MKKIICLIFAGLSVFLHAQGITNTLGGNTSNDKFIIKNISGTDIFTTTGWGYVGIGINNPHAKLHIISTSNTGVDNTAKFESATLGINASHIHYGAKGDWYIRSAASDGKVVIQDSGGNVGIGTNNPLSKLSVGGTGIDDVAIYGIESNSENITNYGGKFQANGYKGIGVYGLASSTSDESNYGGYFEAMGESGDGVYGLASNSNGGTGGRFVSFGGDGVRGIAAGMQSGIGGHFQSQSDGAYGVYSIAHGGSSTGVYGKATKGIVGYGSDYDFYAEGSGTNYGASSSIRWKNNVVEIDDPLDKLANLRGVYFDWDDEHGGKHDIGCIAEEVGKVLPEIVVYEENGIDADGMDYSKLTPLLIEAIKALENRVAELESR